MMRYIKHLKKITFCNSSMKGFPNDLIVTTNKLYLRFHGISGYDYFYSDKELKIYAKEIAKLSAKELWIYFNNDIHGHAVVNAKTLRKLLKY